MPLPSFLQFAQVQNSAGLSCYAICCTNKRKLIFQEDPSQHVCPLPAGDCRLSLPSRDQQVQLLRNLVQLVSRVIRRKNDLQKRKSFHQGASCLPVLPWQTILRPGRKAAQLELQLWYMICRQKIIQHLSADLICFQLWYTHLTELRPIKHYLLISLL